MKLSLRSLRRVLSLSACASLALTGCAADAQSGDDESTGADVVDDSQPLTAGVNGGACLESAYNCKLRDSGGNRIAKSDGSEDWAVASATVLDGDGRPTTIEPDGTLKFNYGQARVMNGKLHLLAMSTANGSAGWFPLDSVVSKTALDPRVGRAYGQDPRQGKMACYEISNAEPDAALAAKKVVKDAQDQHERAGDYLQLTRTNGLRYANLAYNVPGLALGGPSIDIHEAGTKFQRVRVPTKTGQPHLAVQLWVKASDGHYTKKSGTLDFYYGYVVSPDGTKRFGWMAAPALVPSSGCK